MATEQESASQLTSADLSLPLCVNRTTLKYQCTGGGGIDIEINHKLITLRLSSYYR